MKVLVNVAADKRQLLCWSLFLLICAIASSKTGRAACNAGLLELRPGQSRIRFLISSTSVRWTSARSLDRITLVTLLSSLCPGRERIWLIRLISSFRFLRRQVLESLLSIVNSLTIVLRAAKNDGKGEGTGLISPCICVSHSTLYKL